MYKAPHQVTNAWLALLYTLLQIIIKNTNLSNEKNKRFTRKSSNISASVRKQWHKLSKTDHIT